MENDCRNLNLIESEDSPDARTIQENINEGKIINMGIRDYVAELYKDGEITVREAAEILQLNFCQTLEILEKKIGGNVGEEEEKRALDLARKLAEI